MNIVIWAVVGMVVLAGMVALIIVGMRNFRSRENEADPLLARLAEAGQRGEVTSLEEIELEQPFSERVVVPILKRVGELSTRFTPQKQLEKTTRDLELAGNPGRIDAATFLASRFVFMVLLPGFLILVATLSPNKWPVGRLVLVGLIFAALVFFLPQLYLRSRIDRRQKGIRKAMPDALDLLTIC